MILDPVPLPLPMDSGRFVIPPGPEPDDEAGAVVKALASES